MIKGARSRYLLQVVAFFLLFALSFIAWRGQLLTLFTNRAKVEELVRGFGRWGPVVSISLQVVQVVVVPIPGQILDAVNGYLFGAFLGTSYSMVGMLIGSTIVMAISRRFGRPLVERLVNEELLNRLDGFSQKRGAFFFLLFLLFPFLPNDVACFIAGLTPLPLAQLVLLAAIGRLPGILISNLVGASASVLNPGQLIMLIIVFAAIALASRSFFRRVEGKMFSTIERIVDWVGRE
jgi:uncharacterized membrane protein YdjX (TVP38/TMEM64 family)